MTISVFELFKVGIGYRLSPRSEGVFNFVLGPGPEVGDELAGNPGTHAVGFIGSTATGLTVSRRAAGKPQLLEMGGNGPFVVMEDADLDAAGPMDARQERVGVPPRAELGGHRLGVPLASHDRLFNAAPGRRIITAAGSP